MLLLHCDLLVNKPRKQIKFKRYLRDDESNFEGKEDNVLKGGESPTSYCFCRYSSNR